MLLREFLVKDLEKGSSDIGGYISAVWGGCTKLFLSFDSSFQSIQVGMGFRVKR